jgi:hypothetical protein
VAADVGREAYTGGTREVAVGGCRPEAGQRDTGHAKLGVGWTGGTQGVGQNLGGTRRPRVLFDWLTHGRGEHRHAETHPRTTSRGLNR